MKTPVTLLFVLLIASLALNIVFTMPISKTNLDGETDAYLPEPPLPDTPSFMPTNYSVRVVNHLPENAMHGYGILIQHNGKRIVLTSQMIFTRGIGAVKVRLNGGEYPASIFKEDKTGGLTALAIYTDEQLPVGDLVGKRPPIGAEASVLLDETHPVKVERYTKWMMLSGGIPRNSCGAPVLVDDRIVGLVIGLNRRNLQEVVAVDARTLLHFLDSNSHAPRSTRTQAVGFRTRRAARLKSRRRHRLQ